jgi:outer membrane protein
MTNNYKRIFLAGIAAITFTSSATPAIAADLGGALSKERFQIRLRALDIIADGNGRVAQNDLKTDVDHALTPEVDLTYFFTENIAAELIAATAQHQVSAGNFNIGEAWILPPTLTLQYHFTPDRKFSPYVGAGLNYSIFYGESNGTGFNDLDVDGGLGYAVQAGFDYWLNDNWGINLDAKYVNLDIDVDVNLGATHLDADNVDLDPFIIGVGVSYRF